MGPRAGLDGRKISSPPVFDHGRPARSSVAIPTELPGPQTHLRLFILYNSRGFVAPRELYRIILSESNDKT